MTRDRKNIYSKTPKYLNFYLLKKSKIFKKKQQNIYSALHSLSWAEVTFRIKKSLQTKELRSRRSENETNSLQRMKFTVTCSHELLSDKNNGSPKL